MNCCSVVSPTTVDREGTAEERARAPFSRGHVGSDERDAPARAGPPGCSVSVGERPASPPDREAVGVGLRGLGLRGDHTALFDYATSSRGSPGPEDLLVRGRDGNVLALRPDFTSLLAKIAAGRLRDRPAPMRSTTRARSCVTSQSRPAGRASSTRWAWSISGGRASGRRRVLAVAASPRAARRAGLGAGPRHVASSMVWWRVRHRGRAAGGAARASRVEDPAGVRRGSRGAALPVATAVSSSG